MKTDSASHPSDVRYNCEHCSNPLLIDVSAGGLTLSCPQCEQVSSLPGSTPKPATSRSAARSSGEFANALQTSSSPNDWLRDCAFRSRQETLGCPVAPGILSQKWEKTPEAETYVQLRYDEPTPLPEMASSSPVPVPAPAAVPQRMPKANVASELRTFRQLSSAVYCPETNRDSLPEYILFTLIALLAAAWPILAMLGVMKHH